MEKNLRLKSSLKKLTLNHVVTYLNYYVII